MSNLIARRYLMLAGLAAALIWPSTVSAQINRKGDYVNLSANNAEVRTVLRTLFKAAHQSFSVDPDVHGLVTIEANHIDFLTVLNKVLKQVKAIYHIDGGMYDIEVSTYEPPAANGLTLTFHNEDVHDALLALFKQAHLPVVISPGVQGTVTASLQGVDLTQALNSILKSVNATFRVEGGVFEISAATSNSGLLLLP